MRTLLALLFVMSASCSSLFAADLSKSKQPDTSVEKVDRMVQSNVLTNTSGVETIRKESAALTADQKRDIYEKYERNGWNGFLWNLLLPGLGNWLEGDTCGALTFELGLLGSAAALAGGLWLTGQGILSSKYGGNGLAVLGGYILSIAGATGIICFGLTGYTSTFRNANNYNDNLKNSLNLTFTADQENRLRFADMIHIDLICFYF